MPTNTFGRRGAVAPTFGGAVTTFGQRGAVAPTSRPAFQPAAASAAATIVLDRALPLSRADMNSRDDRFLVEAPILTGLLFCCLTLIFVVERRLAIDVARNGSIDVRSLIAYGATSRDLVVGMGEWWRIGLAPLLHSSMSHLIGNSIALFFVGFRLEPLIGRGWLLLIFVVSGLAGEVGSLLGNPPGVPGVGASGAITGLVAALFVASYNLYEDAADQRAMRKTSLFFGIPALGPLFIGGASGHVDYFAHAGGALAGVVLMLWFVRSFDGFRPSHAVGAGMTALAGLVGSLVCFGFASAHYASYAADAARFIRVSELSAKASDVAERSADLVARYPGDPRAHFFRALDLVGKKRPGDAEAELRTAISLSSSDVAGGPVRTDAQGILAALLLEDGRTDEAKAMAVEPCHAKGEDKMQKLLNKVKLCD